MPFGGVLDRSENVMESQPKNKQLQQQQKKLTIQQQEQTHTHTHTFTHSHKLAYTHKHIATIVSFVSFAKSVFLFATMMKAVVENSHDKPCDFAMVDNFPKPSAPAEGQVLIKVKAAATNPVDCVRSFMNIPEAFPVVVGYDVAGVVEAVGNGVTDFAVGDRVFGDVMESSTGLKVAGSLAEYVVVPAKILAKLPDNVSFEAGAAVPVAVMTALQAFRKAGIEEGQNVFVSGGAGGVGVHATQLAKSHFKATAVATTASSAKIDFCKTKGRCDTVINYKTEQAGDVLPDWANVVMDTTKDKENCLKVKKPDGMAVTIADFSDPVNLPPLTLAPSKEDIEETASILGAGTIDVIIDKVFPFEEALKALEYQQSGRAMGKIVVKMD